MDRLQTWVINLDRAPDRLERISMQLQRLGLPFTRLPAVDARALTADQRAALDEAGYRRKHGMAPLPGELGCYLSHLEALRLFLAGQAEFTLILEDDVLLTPALQPVDSICVGRGRLSFSQLTIARTLRVPLWCTRARRSRCWRWRPGIGWR